MTKQTRILARWGLLMAGDSGPILSGCEGDGVYRTSTPLVQFDPASMTGVTATGRPYRLVGPSDPGYALRAFHSLWNTGDADVRVVAPEDAAPLIKRNSSFQHSAVEQAELDQNKLTYMSGQMRMQIRAMEIDTDRAARLSGLTAEQMQGLLEADLTLISADEADAAFIRLFGCMLDLEISEPDEGMKP